MCLETSGVDKKEKSDTQKTVMRLAGKKLLAMLGKPNASDDDAMKFAQAMDEFQEAARFYRYG